MTWTLRRKQLKEKTQTNINIILPKCIKIAFCAKTAIEIIVVCTVKNHKEHLASKILIICMAKDYELINKEKNI